MRKCHFGTLGNLQTLYQRHKIFSKFLLVVHAAVFLSLQLSRSVVFNAIVVRVCLCHVILPRVLSQNFCPSKHLFSFRIQVNFCHNSWASLYHPSPIYNTNCSFYCIWVRLQDSTKSIIWPIKQFAEYLIHTRHFMLCCHVILAITLKEGSTPPTWVQMKEQNSTRWNNFPEFSGQCVHLWN